VLPLATEDWDYYLLLDFDERVKEVEEALTMLKMLRMSYAY
jgi:hypothetical protein